MAVLMPPRRWGPARTPPIYSSSSSASAVVGPSPPTQWRQRQVSSEAVAEQRPQVSREEEIRLLLERAKAGDRQAGERLMQLVTKDTSGGIVGALTNPLGPMGDIKRRVEEGIATTAGAIGAGTTAPRGAATYTAPSASEARYRDLGETVAPYVSAQLVPTSPLDAALLVGPGRLAKAAKIGRGFGGAGGVARAVPEGAQDLEALLKQSLELAKTDPNAARKVFSAEVAKDAGDLGSQKSASSQYFRDKGHVTKRAKAMTEGMAKLAAEQAELKKLQDELAGLGVDASKARTVDEAMALVKQHLDTPGSSLVPDAGMGELSPRLQAARTGAAGLLGGTGAGVGAELDQDPETSFMEAFPRGALAGATSNVGVRLPGMGAAPTTPTTAQQAPNRNPARRFLDELGAIPGALKRNQTSGDVLGTTFRQNLQTAFTNPGIALRNAQRSARAYFNPKVMDEIDALPGVKEERYFQPDGTQFKRPPRLPTLDPETGEMLAEAKLPKGTITVKPITEVLGIGDDFASPGYEKGTVDTILGKAPQVNPLYNASQRSADASLIGTVADLREDFVQNALRNGVTDPSWYKHYDDLAKVQAGYGNVPKALKSISQNFYSLRNLAARFQTFSQPFTKPGQVFDFKLPGAGRAGSVFNASPRGVAWRNLTRFTAGEMANLRGLAFVGDQTGMFNVEYNPLKPGFGKMVFTDDDGNDVSVDLMGGYGSLIQAQAKTAAFLEAKQSGQPTDIDPVAEWIKFFRYKQTSTSAAVTDTFIANTFFGRNPELRSQYEKVLTDPDTWTSGELLEEIAPFFGADTVAKLVRGDIPTTPEGIAKETGVLLSAWGGAPVSSTEASAFDATDAEVRKAVAAGRLPKTYIDMNGQPQPVKSYQDLRLASPVAADRFDLDNPGLVKERTASSRELTQEARKLTDDAYRQQIWRDDNLLRTDPGKWRSDSSAASKELGIRLDQLYASEGEFEREPRGLLDVANKKYHDAIAAAEDPYSGEVDWDQVDLALGSLSKQEQDLLFENRLRGETESRKQYIRDMRVLGPYFESRDLAWKQISAGNPQLSQYKNLDAFRQVIIDDARRMNMSWGEARAMADKVLKPFDSLTQAASMAYLGDHAREVLPLLDKYDFYVPTFARPLVNAWRVTPGAGAAPAPTGNSGLVRP